MILDTVSEADELCDATHPNTFPWHPIDRGGLIMQPGFHSTSSVYKLLPKLGTGPEVSSDGSIQSPYGIHTESIRDPCRVPEWGWGTWAAVPVARPGAAGGGVAARSLYKRPVANP